MGEATDLWGRCVFGELVIAYLFCGGTGAGGLLVACLVDLARSRRTGGRAQLGNWPAASSGDPVSRAVSWAMLGGLALLVFGIACLVCDVGRADRLANLVLSPSPSFLLVGAYTLVILSVVGAFATATRFFCLPAIPSAMVTASEAVVIVMGVVAISYTGLLLSDLKAVAFWASWLVPVLFMLSSLSCGCSLLLLAACAEGADATFGRVLAADVALIALEAVCAAALSLRVLGNEPVMESANAMIAGIDSSLSAIWWMGFVVCGMVVPFITEAIAFARWRGGIWTSRVILACAAFLVLVGGASMRSGVVLAGEWPDVLSEIPAVVAQGLESQELEPRASELRYLQAEEPLVEGGMPSLPDDGALMRTEV